jgi:hypothetical protein
MMVARLQLSEMEATSRIDRAPDAAIGSQARDADGAGVAVHGRSKGKVKMMTGRQQDPHGWDLRKKTNALPFVL